MAVSNEEFRRHLDRASYIVSNMPVESQTILGGKPSKPQKGRLGLDFGNVIKLNGQPEPVPGALQSIPFLRLLFDDDIYIISRVDTDADAEKNLKWLRDHAVIDPAKVHFCYKRDEKAPIAKDLKLTHFVDDRTEVLSHMKSVLFRVALNPTPEQLESFPPGTEIQVVHDWVSIVSSILTTCGR